MYLGELEEWDVYERWLADARNPKIQIPLKKYLCLEETKHCVGKGDYFGDFKKVPEEASDTPNEQKVHVIQAVGSDCKILLRLRALPQRS